MSDTINITVQEQATAAAEAIAAKVDTEQIKQEFLNAGLVKAEYISLTTSDPSTVGASDGVKGLRKNADDDFELIEYNGNTDSWDLVGGVFASTSRLDALFEAYNAGILGYETKADLDADTSQSDQTLALVTNDATASNNAWYRWDDSAGQWVKKEEFYATTLDPADTSEAVTGQAVNEFVLPRNPLEIKAEADRSESANLFDWEKRVNNRDVNSVGEVFTDANNDISNYIKVDPSTEYYRNGSCRIVEYNERGKFIQREGGFNSTNYTTSADTHFVILIGTGFPRDFYFSLATDSGEDYTPFKEGNEYVDTYESDIRGIHAFDGNLLDFATYINASLSNSGVIIDQDSSWLLTNYIPVVPGETYYFSGTIEQYATYSREKRFIRRVGSPPSNVTFNSDEYYIRIVIRTVNEDNAIFSSEVGTPDEAKIKTRLLEKDEISYSEIREEYKTEPYTGCKQIPADLLSRDEITIEFDFYPDFDIHNGNDRIDLFGFGSGVNAAGDGGAARYNVYFMRKPHETDSIFFPKFMSYFGVNHGGLNNESNIETGTQSPHSWYLKDNLCGEDALSIRKTNPSSGDYGTKVTIDSSFTVHDGGGTIYSTALSNHTTVEDLAIDLNNASALSDYEIKVYSGERSVDDLQKMSDIVIVANNTVAGVADAYPLYVPMSSKGKKYHFKFTAKIHDNDATKMDAIASINGHPVYYNLVADANARAGGWDFKGLDFVIGGLLDSESNAFSGTIENITIKDKFEHGKRKLMLTGHTPGGGFDGGLNTSIIQKVYYDSIEHGYTWVDGQEMCRLENTRADVDSSPDRVLALSYDDSRWDVWDFEEHRAMLQKLNIKPVLFIPLDRIDPSQFPDRADTIKQAHSAGWTLGIHSTNNASINELTYAELKDNIDQANTFLRDLGIHSNIFAYPRNEWSIHGAKVLRNDFGNAVLYSTNATGGYYGFNNLYSTRFAIQGTTLDDVIDEESIDNYSKAQFSNLNNSNWSLS